MQVVTQWGRGQGCPRSQHVCLVTVDHLRTACDRGSGVGRGLSVTLRTKPPSDLSAAIYRNKVQALAVPWQICFPAPRAPTLSPFSSLSLCWSLLQSLPPLSECWHMLISLWLLMITLEDDAVVSNDTPRWSCPSLLLSLLWLHASQFMW